MCLNHSPDGLNDFVPIAQMLVPSTALFRLTLLMLRQKLNQYGQIPELRRILDELAISTEVSQQQTELERERALVGEDSASPISGTIIASGYSHFCYRDYQHDKLGCAVCWF